VTLSALSALLAEGDSFTAPGTEDFWQPVIGSGAWSISRASVVLTLSAVGIGWFLLVATKRLALVPTGKRQFLTEYGYGFVRNTIARDVIGSRDFLKFVPMLFTMFCLILVNNLFGIIPPVLFPTMSRVGFPVALTLFTFVVYHAVGIRKMGFGGYFKHVVPPGTPTWVVPILWPLEMLTYFFTRPVSLALRLFGNMFAGHLLLVLFVTGGEYLVTSGSVGLVGAGLFSWVMGVVMTVFEILVQFLQAYIFVLLSALYIAGSLADEH
jgi:F-type H+-transporting ATPase subunit a